MILSIFSNCKIVKGINRSLIVDLQRSCYFIIPNDLTRFIEMVKGKDYKLFFSNLEDNDKNVVSSYVDFILSNEIGFFHQKDILVDFGVLSSNYGTPYLLTNLSIEINANSIQVLDELGRRLEGKMIQCIELICFKDIILPYQLFKIIDALSSIAYDELRIILKHTKEYSLDYVKKICMGNIQIFSFLLHSAEMEIDEMLEDGITSVTFQTNAIGSCFDCGKVSDKYFTSNKDFYFEGLLKNTCLNMKVGIDSAGNIKNCLSQMRSYGNIFEADLLDIFKSNDFQKLWNVTKDKVN